MTVADAHAKALITPSAAGQRFITSAGPFCQQDLTTSLAKVAPSLDLPQGEAGAAEKCNKKQQVFSGKKAEKELGITFRSIDETVKDMYESIKAKGFVGGDKKSQL